MRHRPATNGVRVDSSQFHSRVEAAIWAVSIGLGKR